MNRSDRSAEADALLEMRQEVERITKAYIERLLQSEEALSEHVEFLRTILDCMGDGLIAYDDTGKVLLANNAACRLAGFELGETDRSEIFRKFTFRTSKDGPLLSPDEEPFRAALKERRSVVKEGYVTGETLPAEGMWLRANASPVIDENKNIHGVVTIFHDISERKQVQHQRDGLASLVTHDIKNHLVGLQLILDHLLRSLSGSVGDEVLDLISKMQASNKHHLELASSLMEIYRSEFVLDSGSAVDTHLEQIVQIAVFLNRLQAAAKGVQVELDLEEGIPSIKGIPAALRHVFFNLIQNAIKASQSGQTVKVSLKRAPHGIVLSVRDFGSGLTEREIENLFNPSALARRRSDLSGSSGLGLFLSKLLLDAHNARITCSSTPREGTSFEVLIAHPS